MTQEFKKTVWNKVAKPKAKTVRNKVEKSAPKTTRNKESKPKKVNLSKSWGLKKMRKPTGEKDLFLKISKVRSACEICGKKIKVFKTRCFAHILAKGQYPRYRLYENNIAVVCSIKCHQEVDRRVAGNKYEIEQQITKGIYINLSDYDESITLYWRIPSKKNSKVWTGKFMVSQKAYAEREKAQMQYLASIWLPKLSINYPVSITYKFLFPDKRPTDLSNKIESVNDMLVKYGYLSDDKCTVVSKITAEFSGVDMKRPRVVIVLERQYIR